MTVSAPSESGAGQPLAEVSEPDPVPMLLTPRDGVPPLVTTPQALEAVTARLRAGSGPVAVDAERASGYRYGQRAYLVQLRRAGVGSVLVDPAALADLSSLGEAIADSEWVLHAASQDLTCLAEVGMRPARLFDTELASRLAGFERVGLGAVVERLLGVRLEKGHSAADWSTRPLPEPWLRYAALDVELLIEVRDLLAEELARQGKLEWAHQEFAAILAAGPAPARIDPWRRVSGMHRVRTPRQAATVRGLWEARDMLARQRDIAPGRLLADSALVAVAVDPPPDRDTMAGLPVFRGPKMRRTLDIWFGAVSQAQRLPAEQLPPVVLATDGPPPASRWSERDPEAAARLARVRETLGAIASAHTLPVEQLLEPALARRLAWRPDGVSAAEVAAQLDAGGARPWQVELVAGALAAALAASE